MTDEQNCRAEFEAWALRGKPASAWENWQLCWQAARAAAPSAEQIRAEALEAAAKVCEDMRDLKEAKRAHDAATAALERGDDRDSLSRLRHQSTVSLFNGALERAAREIRLLASSQTAAKPGEQG